MLPLPFGSIGVMAQGNGQISVVSATASSAFSADYGADKMIDGDASDTSRWCSGGSNPVLEFTFNGAQKVNKIIINEFLNPNPGNSVESFTVNAWDRALIGIWLPWVAPLGLKRQLILIRLKRKKYKLF